MEYDIVEKRKDGVGSTCYRGWQSYRAGWSVQTTGRQAWSMQGPPHHQQQSYQNSESGRKCGMGECSRVHLTTCRARLGGAHSIASFLHNEQGQRELTTRGRKRQARETEYMYQVRDQNSAGILLARQPREEGNKEDKENPGQQTKVNGHLNMDTAATSTTDADTQKTLNQRRAKRQIQSIHPLRIHPLPQLTEQGRLNTTAVIPFNHPRRRNEHEIPAVRNEQKIGAEDLKRLLFAH